MNTPKIESFLEKADMNFLFCLLSKMEIQRINQLPAHVKSKFMKKITVIAMEHVAENDVPDYITEIAEAELAMAEASAPNLDDDFEYEEESIDDSVKFVDDLEEGEVLDTEFDDEDEEEDGE